MPKILEEDEKSVQIEKPSGERLTIAKKGLSDKVLSALKGGWATPEGAESWSDAKDISANGLFGPRPGGPAPASEVGPVAASGEPAPAPALPMPDVPSSTPSPAPAAPAPVATPADPNSIGALSSKSSSLVDQGFAQQARGIEGMAKAQAAQAETDGKHLAVMEKAYADEQIAIQKAQENRQKMASDIETKLRDQDDKIAQAQPKDYWADRSTGAKIGAAIAIGLGAYAAAKTGGPNNALAIIDSAIQRDIDRQAAVRQGLKEERGNIMNTYQMKLGEFNDEGAARAAATASAYQMTIIRLQQSAATAKSAQAKDQANMMIGDLKQKQGAFYAEAANKRAESASKQAEIDSKLQETLVPGMGQHATTKEGAAKLNQLVADTNVAKDGIRKLVSFVGKSGKSLNPEMRAEADTTANMLKGAMRTLLVGPGAVSEGERKIIDSVIADPTSVFSLDASNKKRLETLMKRLDVNLAKNAQAYGLKSPSTSKSSIEEVPN